MYSRNRNNHRKKNISSEERALKAINKFFKFIKVFFIFLGKKLNQLSAVKWPKFVNRFNFVFLVIFLLYILYIHKLYQIQIVEGQKFKSMVDKTASGIQDKKKIFNRGEIYFTNKKGEKIVAAGMKTKYSLIISPADIKDSEKIYNEINKIVKIDKEKYTKALKEHKKSKYYKIKEQISEKQKKLIKKLRTNKVYVEEQTGRFYPLGDVGSEVLGFVAIDGIDGVKKGMYGLEKQYDRILSYSDSLKPVGIFKKIFASSKKIFSKKIITDDGYIETTIDVEMQKKLQEVLKNIDKKYKSEFSSGIIMRPYSGEIVAMSSSKPFNLNDNPKDYRIIQVENRYEFGSIFKPLVIAIGLETKSITKNFSFNDKGYMILNRRRIQNYDGRGRGPGTNIYKIISQSLNTGVAVIALRIGVTKFVEYLDELGLSTETNIDLPGETFGNISNLNSGKDIELATASFGQGISLTAVGIVKAMSAIANGGSVPNLHIVKKIIYKQYMDDEIIPEKRKRIFSSETANFVRDVMVKSADNVLKHGKMKRKFHSVAVKTGTAQIVKPTGGYYRDKNVHFFQQMLL